jgi:hypothetical protein
MLPTSNFSVFDGQELVDYSNGIGTISGVQAVRRPLSQSSASRIEQFGIMLAPDHVPFHLNGDQLQSQALAAGDNIVDAQSVEYTVVFVERQDLGHRVLAIAKVV